RPEFSDIDTSETGFLIPLEGDSGSVARTDRAIWIESGDSVGFSMGFACTAFIPEEQAAKFLYWYPIGSLAEVLDHELRGRIQPSAAEVAPAIPSTVSARENRRSPHCSTSSKPLRSKSGESRS